MSKEIVSVRNLVTRRVGKMERSVVESLISRGKPFEIVPDGTKDFLPLEDLVSKKRTKPRPQKELNDEKEEVEA